MNLYQSRPPIFSAGIVWDPREPLPLDYAEDAVNIANHSYPSEGPNIADHGYIGSLHQPDGRKDPGSLPKRRHAPAAFNKHPIPSASTPEAGQMLHDSGVTPFHTVNFIEAHPFSTNVKPPIVHKLGATHVVREETRSVLPPSSITIKANVVYDTANITVTQLFWNDADNPIPKGSYTFPLPSGCSVTSFNCEIGDKKLKGSVTPREEARTEFNQAVTAGRQTGLLEQGTPEIFTASLGNIPPDTAVKAEITLTTLLKHRFVDKSNLFTFTIPTCIADRYGSRPDNVEDTTSNEISDGLTIQVHVSQAEIVTKVVSESHKIIVNRGPLRDGAPRDTDKNETIGPETQTTIVKLQNGSTFLDKDFVLDIETKPETGIEEPQAWLEEHPTLTGHQAMMLTIPPRFMARTSSKAEAQEIIFVADRSGSMDDKIKSLKSALAFFLKGIPVGKMFNLWCFGSRFDSLWSTSMEYTEENLRRAEDYVSSFRADMGGTELFGVLKALTETLDSNRLCDVIILTDGEVWRLEQTLDLIQETRTFSEGRVRFFSLGIGHAVSHTLVEGIAKSGGGYSEVIQTASQGGWEDRVVAMLKATLSKHVGPLQIDLKPQANKFSVTKSPADISNINPFQPSRIFMLFDEKAVADRPLTITIKTEDSESKELLTEVPIHRLATKDSILHNLGARAILDDLEYGMSEIHLSRFGPERGSIGEARLVCREAEKIACKYSLISKWTSFLLENEDKGSQDHERPTFITQVNTDNMDDGLHGNSSDSFDRLHVDSYTFLRAKTSPPYSPVYGPRISPSTFIFSGDSLEPPIGGFAQSRLVNSPIQHIERVRKPETSRPRSRTPSLENLLYMDYGSPTAGMASAAAIANLDEASAASTTYWGAVDDDHYDDKSRRYRSRSRSRTRDTGFDAQLPTRSIYCTSIHPVANLESDRDKDDGSRHLRMQRFNAQKADQPDPDSVTNTTQSTIGGTGIAGSESLPRAKTLRGSSMSPDENPVRHCYDSMSCDDDDLYNHRNRNFDLSSNLARHRVLESARPSSREQQSRSYSPQSPSVPAPAPGVIHNKITLSYSESSSGAEDETLSTVVSRRRTAPKQQMAVAGRTVGEVEASFEDEIDFAATVIEGEHLGGNEPNETQKENYYILPGSKRALIHNLNHSQRWDGAFDVSNRTMGKLFGKANPTVLQNTISHLKSTSGKLLSYIDVRIVGKTLLILAILEKSFHDLKGLWEMMWENAIAFLVEEFSEEAELYKSLDVVRESLGGETGTDSQSAS